MDLARAPRRTARKKGSGYENGLGLGHWSRPVNSMSFIWNDNMREKREANANATWRALIRDRPRGDGV
jgi:hypothetical protein